jgi:hypothetical protein
VVQSPQSVAPTPKVSASPVSFSGAPTTPTELPLITVLKWNHRAQSFEPAREVANDFWTKKQMREQQKYVLYSLLPARRSFGRNTKYDLLFVPEGYTLNDGRYRVTSD